MRHATMRQGLLATALTGLCAAAPVAAQDLLAVEELKTCLTIQRDLEQRRAALDGRSETLRRNETRLDQINAEVADRGRLVKSSDRGLSAEYDRLREERSRLYAVYAEAARNHNAEVAAYNNDLAEYDRRCGAKQYNEASMRQAKRELGLE